MLKTRFLLCIIFKANSMNYTILNMKRFILITTILVFAVIGGFAQTQPSSDKITIAKDAKPVGNVKMLLSKKDSAVTSLNKKQIDEQERKKREFHFELSNSELGKYDLISPLFFEPE